MSCRRAVGGQHGAVLRLHVKLSSRRRPLLHGSSMGIRGVRIGDHTQRREARMLVKNGGRHDDQKCSDNVLQ